ncbi:MAG: signal peptidase I [Opitutaceae bacterium]|nr:signal peptidase I [Opitutaceae bacterium]
MFGFLQSENKKLRNAAKNWLYLGHKVYNFRKDELSGAEISELARRIDELRAAVKTKPADSGKLKLSIEAMEDYMRKVGGAFYPQSSLGENVDFALYFLIIYLGFTAFFIKPFKIPTNSMWPTYNGMTSEVWSGESEAPGFASRTARLLTFGAIRYEMKAPADGELLIPVRMGRSSSGVAIDLPTATVSKRHHLIVPGKGVGYTFEVGGKSVLFKVPRDFDLARGMPMNGAQGESILGKAWFPDESSFWEAIQKKIVDGQVARRGRMTLPDGRSVDVAMVRSGLRFEKGDTMLSFDIHTGDQLFVDRMSYHFVRPKVGDGFVFRTGEIRNLSSSGDKYYIKRLAGTPGDTMEIEGERLFVNGDLATGSIAFTSNNSKEAPYDGYFNGDPRQTAPGFRGLLRVGEEITVPEDAYVALGDNSGHSYDSRGWGYVPESMVVGRPVMIFYPFTKRFGLAK